MSDLEATPATAPGPISSATPEAPVREDILASAVRFLQDPKVQESPLAKRIAFLESKGLTAAEIQVALTRTSSAPASTSITSSPSAGFPAPTAYPLQQQPQQYLPYPQYAPPPPPAYSWKDITLGVIGAAGAGYGAYALFMKHILPHLSLSTPSNLSDSTAQIAAQIANTSTVLDGVQSDTKALVTVVGSQAEEVAVALKGLTDILTELKERDASRETDMKAIRKDVDDVRAMIPTMLDKNRDAQTTVISDLQTEIKSLKNLLLNRRIPLAATSAQGSTTASLVQGDSASSSGPTVAPVERRTGSFAGIPTKPTIPAWQLQAERKGPAAGASPIPEASRSASPVTAGRTEGPLPVDPAEE
ncbi:peroxisomal membrane protein pex14 [Thoreauomyces humboldtii]|nr:peroxisomal membrane protein pex14 [Thoreauomyces humboldtii]